MTASNSTLGNASYVYDANGRRVQKTVGSTTTDFIYDLAGSVIAEKQGSTWTKAYVYADGQLLAQYDNTVTPNTTYFAHKDHLGSTRLLTKVDQTAQECDGYQPFGELDTSVCTPMPPSPNNSTTHKFTGKERDSESGLDNFGARYFASTLGRFTSPDPKARSAKLADPQSWNRYTYVGNNPLAFIDPDGRDKLSVTLTTSIPTRTVREPIPVFGRTFSGGPKTRHTVAVETDARKSANPELSKSHDVFPTKKIGDKGEVLDVKQGSDSSLKEGAARNADGSVNVNFQGNAGLPFNPLAPGITYDINVTCTGSTCSATSGSHDGFPGYTIEVTNEAGKTTTIYEYDPRAAGKGPGSLWPPAECKVGGNSECDKRVKTPKPEEKKKEEK
jgi:RHS repeat-associated protein